MESEDGRVSSIPAGIAKSGDCSGSNSGSDLEYTDCESLMSSEEEEDDDDDTYDFDPIEYFEELSSLDRKKTGVGVFLVPTHFCVCLQRVFVVPHSEPGCVGGRTITKMEGTSDVDEPVWPSGKALGC